MSRLQVTKDFLGLAYRTADFTETDILIDATDTFRILQRRYEETISSEIAYKNALKYLCEIFMQYCRKYCPAYCK